MFNVVYIIMGMFLGLIAISNSIEQFPSFLPKNAVLIIILVFMIVGLKAAPRSGNKTNKNVLTIQQWIMVNPPHVNNLDSLTRSDLLNQLDLVFTKKDEKALEKCKNILTSNKI